MNLGGLILLVVLAGVALLARRSLRGAPGALAAFQRRMLLGLAVALPLFGLVLPRVPWKAAAVGLILLLAVAVEVVLRALERHDAAAARDRHG